MSSRTSALFSFNETKDEVLPTDRMGNLYDLVVPSGLGDPPTAVQAWCGYGRLFPGDSGYSTSENAESDRIGSNKLIRSMAIEALIDMDALVTAGAGAYCIAARGFGNGDPGQERIWGLDVVIVGGGLATLQMHWDSGGGEAEVDASPIFSPPSRWAYVAGVRRWVSATEVYVDYYCNGLFLGTVTTADGDIEVSAEDGAFSVGMRGDGAGDWERFFVGTIDELRISNDERTAAEIEDSVRKIFILPGQAYELMRALMPPGDAYSRDPGSVIQRELMVQGDALAMAWGLLEELFHDWFPDRATQFLGRWETVLKLSPKPGDSIATRQRRLLARTRSVQGYSVEKVKETLAEVLDTTVDQLVIIEGSNIFDDNFAATFSNRWLKEENEGVITPGAGLELKVETGELGVWNGGFCTAPRMRSSIEGRRLEIALDIFSIDATTAGDAVGVFLLDRVTHNSQFFGIQFKPGDNELRFVHKMVGSNGFPNSSTYLGTDEAPGSDVCLRMRSDPSDDTYVIFEFSEDGLDGTWTQVATSSPVNALAWADRWVGFAVMAGADVAAADVAMVCNGARIISPDGLAPFHWHVFRDPGDPGVPDMAGANLIIQRMKPAHTRGSVCATNTLQYDNTNSRYDRDPMAD